MLRKLNYKSLIISLVLVVVSINLIKSTVLSLRSRQRLEDLNNKVLSLEIEKRALEADIEYKKTNGYIEEKARNDLNMVKPGEKVFVVEGVEESAENALTQENVLSAANSKDSSRYKNSNWYLWYRLFF